MSLGDWQPDLGDEATPRLRQALRLALAVACGLGAALFSLPWSHDLPVNAVTATCAVSIVVLAVVPGGRTSLAASLLGVTVLVLWTAHANAGLSALGLAVRVAPTLVLSLALGELADRLRRAGSERRRRAAASNRCTRTIETSDTIVQSLSAAKWSLESGNTDQALRIVTDALQSGHQLLSELVREAGCGSAWTGVAGTWSGSDAPGDRPAPDDAPAAGGRTQAPAARRR